MMMSVDSEVDDVHVHVPDADVDVHVDVDEVCC